jgi:CPA2 family monovalent cation:H+ antiporter-2
VLGDVTEPGILDAAGVGKARVLVIATADSYQTRHALEVALAHNRDIGVVVRTHSEDEFRELSTKLGGNVVMDEHELARAMTRHTLARFSVGPEGRARKPPNADPS